MSLFQKSLRALLALAACFTASGCVLVIEGVDDDDDDDCSCSDCCYSSRECWSDYECEWSYGPDAYCNAAGYCALRENERECWSNDDCRWMYGDDWACNSFGFCEKDERECWSDRDCRRAYGDDWTCNAAGSCVLECEDCWSECETDSDCVWSHGGGDWYCDTGYCEQRIRECWSDDDCLWHNQLYGGNWVCGADGYCLESEPECRSNADCGDYIDECGGTVNGVCDYGRCWWYGNDSPCEVDCWNDNECADGFYCDRMTLQCKPMEAECQFDSDCGDTGDGCSAFSCIQGQCIAFPSGFCCQSDLDCPQDDSIYCSADACFNVKYDCVYGACVESLVQLGCQSNDDCAASDDVCAETACIEGVCVEKKLEDCCVSDIDCNPQVYRNCKKSGAAKCVGFIEEPTRICLNNHCEEQIVDPECLIASDCAVPDDICQRVDCVEGACVVNQVEGCCHDSSECPQPDCVGLVSVCYENHCSVMVQPECVVDADCGDASDDCSTMACEAGRCVESAIAGCCHSNDDCPVTDSSTQIGLCLEQSCVYFQAIISK